MGAAVSQAPAPRPPAGRAQERNCIDSNRETDRSGSTITAFETRTTGNYHGTLDARRLQQGDKHMIGFILYLVVIGLVAGFIARALVPGRDPMTVGATMILGIVGSFIGGLIGYVLTHHDAKDGAFQASGIIGSIFGAVIALVIYRAVTGRRHHLL
jgi:uncharacterized membrane protein YeaQ/YmgE (transglycosylase-associated protein family)